MLRIQVFLSAFLTLTLTTHAQSTKTAPKAVNVKRGQVLIFSLLTSLDSDRSNVGDDVQLKLVRPLITEGTTILPSGWIVNGKVTKVKRASRNCNDGKIEWKYSLITLPGGKQIKVQSVDSNPQVYADPVPERVHLDTAGDKLGKGTLRTAENVGLISFTVALSPLLVPMGIFMGGPGCKGEMGKKESLSPGIISFYAAVSKDVTLP